MVTIKSALHELNKQLGISEADFDGKVTIEGKDPVVASRHHIGESTAVLLALFGMELAAIWRQRTGKSQDVKVNVRNAVCNLAAVLPPQVELSGFKLGPRFNGDPNGASKLDWSVFTEAVPELPATGEE